jgi:PRTRC genetic system protein C
MAQLKRVFVYKNKELPEIMGSPEANLKHYETIYPELVNGMVTGPEIKDEKVIYTFEPKVGTKG